jgi:hypothetical protein
MIWRAVVGIALLVGALAISSAPASAKEVSKAINGTLSVGGNVPALTLDKKQFCNCGSSNTQEAKALPHAIGSGQTITFQYFTPPVSTDSATIHFYYRIGKSTYYMAGYVHVPHIGANQMSCKVQFRDRTDTDTSPYTCSVAFESSTSGYRAKPKFTLSEKPVTEVTDSTDQVDLVNQYFTEYCSKGDFQRCTYTDLKVQYYQTSPAEQVGRLQQNCTDTDHEYEVRWKTEHRETNSFGTKLKSQAGVSMAEVVKASVGLELSYEHGWEDSVSFDETTRIKVPPGKTGGIYLSSGRSEVSGNFRLVGPDKIYLLKDVHVTYPLKGTVKDAFGKVYQPILTSRIVGDAPCAPTRTAPPETTAPSTTSVPPTSTAPTSPTATTAPK